MSAVHDVNGNDTSRDPHVSDVFQLGLAREATRHVIIFILSGDEATKRKEGNSANVVNSVHMVDGFRQVSVQVHQ